MTLDQLTEWANFFKDAEVTIGNGKVVWTLAEAYMRSDEPVAVLKRRDKWGAFTKREINITRIRLA